MYHLTVELKSHTYSFAPVPVPAPVPVMMRRIQHSPLESLTTSTFILVTILVFQCNCYRITNDSVINDSANEAKTNLPPESTSDVFKQTFTSSSSPPNPPNHLSLSPKLSIASTGVQSNLEENSFERIENAHVDTGGYMVDDDRGHLGLPSNKSTPHISLVSWRWDHVSIYAKVAMLLLLASLIKLIYHHLHYLESYFPESCALIILGITAGFIIKLTDSPPILSFNENLFFYLLLPPIILESAYSLHDKAFFHNLPAILLYAVIGTILNVVLIGLTLYWLANYNVFGPNVRINFWECLTFSTIISAVDPVAVLAIFHEIGVNKSLYFLVFGESLLNDAVVIVLYSTVTTFATIDIVSIEDILLGVVSFFTVSGGGLAIGFSCGIFTALITKYTHEAPVTEPLIVIIIAYLSYIGAEMFHLSGIISLIACGLVQYEYIADNLTTDSLITIKYFIKNMSSISDVIIFFYLGRVLIRDDHTWVTSFIAIATVSCVVYRFVSIFFLTLVANKFMQSLRRIKLGEQLIMAYGGLRGAIAFSLAVTLDANYITNYTLFVTTTLFIVIFTVFFLGSTTKPLIKWLNIKLDRPTTASMFNEINDRVVDTLMAGIEGISDVKPTHSITLKFTMFNENVLKGLLTRGEGHSFKHTYEAVKWSSIRRSVKVSKSRPTSPSVVSQQKREEGVTSEFRLRSPPAGRGMRRTETTAATRTSLSSRRSLNERGVSVTSSRKIVHSMFEQSEYYKRPKRNSIVHPRLSDARSKSPTVPITPTSPLSFASSPPLSPMAESHPNNGDDAFEDVPLHTNL